MQYFDLYGKSEREFDAARPGIHAANLRHSRSIARCLFGFMLLCSVLSLVGVLDRSYVVTYATILVCAVLGGLVVLMMWKAPAEQVA